MVSALWKAASDGDFAQCQQLLQDTSLVNMEVKDLTGATPLIQAVRNGHLEIVKELLDKGADPHNASSQGLPETYTSDPVVLELLDAAKARALQHTSSVAYDPTQGYTHDPTRGYYPPPGAYAYYPGMYPGNAPVPDGGMAFYAPPLPQSTPPQNDHSGGSFHASGSPGNLPPPEVAKAIPCRYFPACRYGTSCMFAHPQVPYFQGPLPPPAHYPTPYDPMTSPPYPNANFYPIPPVSYPPNGPHPHMGMASPASMSSPHPTSPHAPSTHARSSSEIVSPVQGPFATSGAPLPIPTYTAGAPTGQPYPLTVPPPSHTIRSPTHSQPQSPPQVTRQPMSPVRASPASHISTQPLTSPTLNGHVPASQPPISHGDGSVTPIPNINREFGHVRRGSLRRTTFGGMNSRKPPCLFFPAGRCRNGDECRFPHVLADGSLANSKYVSRPRPNADFEVIDEKLGKVTLRDAVVPNGFPAQLLDTNGVRRGSQAIPNNGAGRHDKRASQQQAKQRVPGAEDFPVLGGTTTPPLGSSIKQVNGHAGPTAAQVLQAPAPLRRDSALSSGSSELAAHAASVATSNVHLNGHVESGVAAESDLASPSPAKATGPVLAPTFASVAFAVPDAKAVSVSA